MLVGGCPLEDMPSFDNFVVNRHANNSMESVTTTYTELTPLQPMSPFKGGIDTADITAETPGVYFYDHLEPLKPTAMVNDSGQLEPCLQSPSYFTSGTACFLLTPPCDNTFETVWKDSPVKCVSQRDSSYGSPCRTPAVHNVIDTAYVPQTPSPISVSLDDDHEINTVEVAERISAELRRYNISQSLFAQRVLSRSQGTLSELLRNPKPWSKMKTGRETYLRMLQWLQEPESERLAMLKRAGLKVNKS